jgi:hypothetical protein
MLVAQLEEFLRIDRRIGPGDFADVNQTFYARHDFQESTVVFDIDHPSLDDLAFLDTRGQYIPGMRSQLLQAKADPLLSIVEIQHHHLQLLIQLQHLARMADTSPADIGDIQQTVQTTQVHKGAKIGDILDRTFQHLPFLQLADDLGALRFDIAFDQGLV